MKRNYFISIAMATFNGEKYIYEQLKSILNQLKEKDEVIISDDGSLDNTLKIIKSFNDKRIKIYNGPKKGIIKNFENAIKNCNGKYIFLADQDDIWMKNKIDTVLKLFETNNFTCIVHDAQVFNSKTNNIICNSFFEFRKSSKGIIRNIIKNSYIGCCMAFDRKIINKILPIPYSIEMHDQWIGILNEKYGKVDFIKDKLIKYRRHDDNASQMNHYPLSKMILNRFKLTKEILKRIGEN